MEKSMVNLQIRTATIQDCAGIQSVHDGTPGPWANMDECVPWIKKRIERGYYVQIAELDGEIVGHAEWVENHDPSGRFFYLSVMQIKPEHQGKGIGREMVEDGIRHAKLLDCTRVVTIPEEETGSDKFYFKCGFVNGRQIKSASIATKEYGYSQNYKEAEMAPFEVIRNNEFVFGLSQASARHMWEVCNAKPAGDNRVTHTLLSANGDCLQLQGMYNNPHKGWALCWSNNVAPAFVKDILTFGKLSGFDEISFDFFTENENLFCEFDNKAEAYCTELYKII